MTAAGFVVAAALGTLARWRLGRSDAGLAAINVAGSFALGLLAAEGAAMVTVFGTGGLGAFTTWSTLALRAVEPGDRPPAARAALLGVTVLLGLVAARLGLALAT